MKNKKVIIFQVVAFLAIAIILIIIGSVNKNSNANSNKSLSDSQDVIADKVEVVYFHSSARCFSCVALEDLTKKAINNNFQDKLSSGELTFDAYNVEFDENKEIIDKFQARSSSLFINLIYDGENQIKEDVTVWRYVSDENRFNDYFINKLNSYFGE